MAVRQAGWLAAWLAAWLVNKQGCMQVKREQDKDRETGRADRIRHRQAETEGQIDTDRDR